MREEGLEDAIEVLLRDPAAVVLEVDDDVLAFPPRPDRDGAAPVGGVDGVVDDVGPDLVEAVAQRADGRQSAVVGPPDRHVLEPVAQDDERILDPVVDVDV